ncbi:growth-regulated alpha protein-like [Serinus canaria]|uniref:growth-regulated alpha protein-like n=1 Tax=Serinus canaria TaxID=9135 RepID=UPI0021CC5659|nr:growth-regulated alpha protein-like [Serinus canaria]
MRLLPALLLLLLLSSSVPAGGLSLESLLTNMRCKCIKSTTHVINLGLILTIHVTPPGIHCRRKEVILTLKKNRQVCVTPEAPWIQLLIHKLMQRNGTKKARPRREAPCCRTPRRPITPSLPLATSQEPTVMSPSWDRNDTAPLL